MDHLQSIVEPGKKFAKDSIRLVKKCTKPDRKEYQKIAFATAVGFAIMGFIGFFVKLIHIPINNILMMNEQPVVFCFSGKRKSGKDFICSRLQEQLNSRDFPTMIRGISYPLKEEYAQLNKLDAEKLKFDYEYKELVRKSMVEFGEQIRERDPHYFCRKTMEKIEEPTNFKFILISDCRRPSDLEFFLQNYKNCRLVRVECTDEVRVQRGFVFTVGIDDQETECALDSFDNWDKRIENNGCLDLLDKQLNELVAEFC